MIDQPGRNHQGVWTVLPNGKKWVPVYVQMLETGPSKKFVNFLYSKNSTDKKKVIVRTKKIAEVAGQLFVKSQKGVFVLLCENSNFYLERLFIKLEKGKVKFSFADGFFGCNENLEEIKELAKSKKECSFAPYFFLRKH